MIKEATLQGGKQINIIDGIKVYIGYSDAEYKQLILEEYRKKLPRPAPAKKLICRVQIGINASGEPCGGRDKAVRYRECGCTRWWDTGNGLMCSECWTPHKEEEIWE